MEETDNKICERVCACLHASLIAGDQSCIFHGDEGKYYDELDFWEEELEPEDEHLCVLSLEGFDWEFWFQKRTFAGMWHRVLHVITPYDVHYLDLIEKEFGVSVLTDGRYYLVIYERKVVMSKTCPVLLNDLLNCHELKKVFENSVVYDDSKYRVPRTDEYEKRNLQTNQECNYCGEIFAEGDMYYDDYKGIYCCDDCYPDYYELCDICEETHNRDEIRLTKDNKRVCESCMDDFTWCDDCEELIHIDDTVYIEEYDITLCDECYDDSDYEHCKKCEGLFEPDDLDEKGLCRHCRPPE